MIKYGYIYCTTDLKNGMKYIGQKKSAIFIPEYKGSGRIIQCKLKNRPEMLRVDLLEWCYSKDELNKCEKDWTDAVGLFPLSYNLISGGKQQGFSDELRKKLSVSAKKRGANNKGKHWKISEEKLKNINRRIGFKHPDETKEKLRKPRSRKWKLTAETIDKMKQPRTQEHKRHIREAFTGLKFFNNGIINCRSKECPIGFISGRIKTAS